MVHSLTLRRFMRKLSQISWLPSEFLLIRLLSEKPMQVVLQQSGLLRYLLRDEWISIKLKSVIS